MRASSYPHCWSPFPSLPQPIYSSGPSTLPRAVKAVLHKQVVGSSWMSRGASCEPPLTPNPHVCKHSTNPAGMILLGSAERQDDSCLAQRTVTLNTCVNIISSLYLPASTSFSRRRKGSGSVCNTHFQCYSPALLCWLGSFGPFCGKEISNPLWQGAFILMSSPQPPG